MGGLALKDITERYFWEDFAVVGGVLTPTLERYLKTDIFLVKAYRQKDSMGDMDLLVYDHGKLPDMGEIKEWITKTFNNKDFHRNGNVLSWDYLHKDYKTPIQVDLILVKPENWESSKIFYLYNELGNLMGKLFNKFGLSYGYDGLKIKYFYKTNKRNIYITKDSKKMFSFIGLSWERFNRGFDTLTEVFDYVIGSPYFNKENFQWENLNNVNLKRNKRRPNYQVFLDYINRDEIEANDIDFVKDKSIYFPKINEFFPEANLYQSLFEFQHEINTKEAVAEKWNGHIIQELYPNLKGPELGKAISGFKKYLEPLYSSYEKYIIDFKIEVIKESFNEYIKQTE